MGVDPAKQLLRKDRILDFDEFQRAQVIFGARKKKSAFHSLPKFRLFPLILTYKSLTALGGVLLIGTIALYGVLSTCITNDNYKLLDTNKSVKNLNLALTQQTLTNVEKADHLRFDEEKAKALGLAPLGERTFIVRTNIKLERQGALTVDALYPLSDRIITVEP